MESKPATTSQYFGSAPKEQLAGLLPTMETSWREALLRHQLPEAWYLIWCQTYGRDPKTGHQTGVQYIGNEMDSLRFRTNLSRPNVRQSIMLALGERPKFMGVATNNDVASLAQIPAVNKMIDYALREANIDAEGYAAVEADRYFGQGYLWLTWDAAGGEMVDGMVISKGEDGEPVMQPKLDPATKQPIVKEDGQPELEPILEPGKVRSGAVVLKRLFPWQVVSEAFIERSSWYIVKEPISKFELAGRYPELAEQILAVDNLDADSDREMFAFETATATADIVILRHVYHKACPAVPKGRHTQILEAIVLEDGPCPLAEDMPVFPMCTMRYFGTSLGYPEVSDLVAQQEVLDDVLSQVVNNLMKFGNESLWAEVGVEFDKTTIAEGGGFFTLGPNQKPPQAIQWAAMPDIAKYLLEFIPGTMNQVSGLNATVLGKPEANVASGTAMALLVNVAERYQHATQAAYDGMLYRVSNGVLEFIRTNAENGYAVEVAGVGNQPYMKYFKQDSLQSVRRVQVVRANPLMSTFPVRLDVLNAISKLPKPDKRSAIELLLTGNMDAFTEEDETQTFLIRYENEAMLGGQQVIAMADDDHRIHNLSHRATRDKLRCQAASPDPKVEQLRATAMEAINAHMIDHCKKWLGLDATLGLTVGVPPAQQDGPPQPGPPLPNGKPGQPVPGKMVANMQPHPKRDLPNLPQPAKPPPQVNPQPAPGDLA